MDFNWNEKRPINKAPEGGLNGPPITAQATDKEAINEPVKYLLPEIVLATCRILSEVVNILEKEDGADKRVIPIKDRRRDKTISN